MFKWATEWAKALPDLLTKQQVKLTNKLEKRMQSEIIELSSQSNLHSSSI